MPERGSVRVDRLKQRRVPAQLSVMTQRSRFLYFKISPDIIRLGVMKCIRFQLSLRKVKDPLHERDIEVSHETLPFRWRCFGLMFAAERSGKHTQNGRSLQINALRPREGSTVVPPPPPTFQPLK